MGSTSGQAFVKTAESRVAPLLPVVVYKINPDGDMIKYALYSNRKPSTICSYDNADALASIVSPYLLITKFPGDAGLKKVLSQKKYRFVAYGNINSHQLAAYMVNVEKQPSY